MTFHSTLLIAAAGALSEQCGTVVRLLLAGGYEPQISSKAAQSIPLFQFIA